MAQVLKKKQERNNDIIQTYYDLLMYLTMFNQAQ